MKGVDSRIIVLVIALVVFSVQVLALSGPPIYKSCTDSDGPNPFTKGVTVYNYINLGTIVKEDRCAGPNVTEYVCPDVSSASSTDQISANVVLDPTPIADDPSITPTTDPTVLSTAPDPSLLPFRTFKCDFGCAAGVCATSAPAVAVDAKTSYSTPDDLRVHCFSSSNVDIKNQTYTIKGYDMYGRNLFTKIESIDCNFYFCDSEKKYTAAERAITNPGSLEITCETVDYNNKKKNQTITMNTTCSIACADKTPPFIETLALNPIRTNYVWLDFNATDYTAGMKNMSLVIYYKPSGSSTYQVYSNESRLCASTGCLYYKVLKGTGSWIANATAYDNAGNLDKKETRITN